MKKYGIITVIVGAVGAICANFVASFWWFNQPKAPKSLSK